MTIKQKMNKSFKNRFIRKRITIFILLVFCFVPIFRTWGMQSSNYRIDEDSINFGGTEESSSANYRLSDTMGEIGTGEMETGCSSLSFNGGDSVTVSDDDSLDISDTLTISMWVYPTGDLVGYSAHPIRKNSNTTSANYSLYYFGTTSGNNRTLRFYSTSGGVWRSMSGDYVVSLNNWYHVVLSYESSIGGQLYVNGNSVGGRVGSGVLSTNTDALIIGADDFPGSIDEVVVYNRAISSTEASDLYQGKHISDTGMVGRWNFNEGSGSVANDVSGNGNNGSISGATFSLNYPASTCNILNAGYRQMNETYLAISSPADVTMSPAIGGVTGGTGNGSAVWNVKTDSPAGYQVSTKASTSPALKFGSYSFADYTETSTGTPDYNWSVATADSEFGYTIEGSGAVLKFLDNGSSACNTGSSNTIDKCWYKFATSDFGIVSSSLPNHPLGADTTIKFKAQSGSGHLQAEGSYTATITVTALAL
jgi:hypothetical protein